MRRYLFLDNYRGFSNANIPIADVNFLVGENSTGKTSVLGLLRLLSSPRFFLGENAVSDDVGLGHFNELVSAHSTDRTYFRIGTTQERPDGRGKNFVSGVLFTYREQTGLPRLEQITCAIEDREVHLRFEPDRRILCRNEDIARVATVGEMNEHISGWIRVHCEEGSGWSELEVPEEIRGENLPLAIVLSWAWRREGDKGPFGFFVPPFGPSLVWIDPIRTKPRRTYDEPRTSFSPDGAHTPYVIRRMLSSQTDAARFAEFFRRVGKASGLFQKVDTRVFGDDNDATARFEVDIFLDGEALNLSWVGYGVSQSLPILVELLDRPRDSWFAIQQPEVHLHPRAQASLGDVFYEMALRDNKHFLIETHSDFAIDRFRMNYRRKRSKNAKIPESQVLFFERRDKHNSVTSLPIGPRGELPSDQPDGYRQFFLSEQLSILDL